MVSQDNLSFDWKAFSRNTWVIVAAGLLLPPVGMILAWLHPQWATRTKWTAIGLMGLIFIGRFRSTSESSLALSDVSQVSETAPASSRSDIPQPPSGTSESYKRGWRKGVKKGVYVERGMTQHNTDASRSSVRTVLENLILEQGAHTRLLERDEKLLKGKDLEDARSRHLEDLDFCKGQIEGYISVVGKYVE
jgi:hypothetical protein